MRTKDYLGLVERRNEGFAEFEMVLRYMKKLR